MERINNLILGAGPAGLGAAWKLTEKGQKSVILDNRDSYGGLCGNFSIQGFRFDRFVHFSFAKDETVNRLFMQGSPEVIRHSPNPYNIYKGKWIKHPAQNNLYVLEDWERELVVRDFLKRPVAEEITQPEDYEQWLRLQYGNYFAEHFPMVYTRKYWMTEAKDLETRWVGSRLYQPSIEEVLAGSRSEDKVQRYYAKEMRYPVKGGYKQYFAALAEGQDIRYHKQVVKISPEKKTLFTADGEIYIYDRLISSLPLPEVMKMLDDIPNMVREASSKLRCTCGYQISIGLKGNNIPPYLWWYIYDEDILPARVYSPSLKSPDNVPDGCSSLQMEIYCGKEQYTEERLLENSLEKLIALGVLREEDVLFTDIRFEPYANVIFDHNIYVSRKVVREYLKSIGIETIGRFGEWGYLWSDQSLMSGLKCRAAV